MRDQPLTREDLEGITAAFTTVLIALTGYMATLKNQVDNSNNNGNQQKDKRREPIKVPQGGNNCVAIVKIEVLKKKNPMRKR